MPHQTRSPIAPSSLPKRLRIRLARYIRRRLLWIVPIDPWEIEGIPMPIPLWVRELFARDPHNAQMVEDDVVLAVEQATLFPPTEGQQWCWLKTVAYRLARELARREGRHLASLQPPQEGDTAATYDVVLPCPYPSPEAVVEARELLALSVEVWGDSERDRQLLEIVLDGVEENVQESPAEQVRRRRNIAYRRCRVKRVLAEQNANTRKLAA